MDDVVFKGKSHKNQVKVKSDASKMSAFMAMVSYGFWFEVLPVNPKSGTRRKFGRKGA